MSIISFKNTLIKAIVSGIMIGIAGTAYLTVSNRYFGAFLFSFALFTIIQFGFSLYTGRVGYIPEKKPSYILEVITAFVGNLIGTGLTAFLLSFTNVWEKLHPCAVGTMDNKLSETGSGSFVLGIFCGLLMYLAVENAAVCRKNNNDTSLVFGTVLPVVLFIFCGFNHSIADSFYIFASSVSVDAIIYLAIVALGNAVGGMLIPVVKILVKDDKTV